MTLKFEYQEQLLPGATLIYINSSLLKLASCRRRLALTLHGFAPEEDKESVDILETGRAIHKFAEEFSKNGGDCVEAMAAAVKEFPHVPRATILACAGSRAQVNIPPPYLLNGRPCVEFTFKIPWYSFIVNEQLYQLVLCGTIDHLSFDGRNVRIYDYKTSRYRMAEYALAKYKHSSQFAFYQWIVYEFGPRIGLPLEVQNAVRGGRIASHVVPVLLTANPPRWVIGPIRYLSNDQFAGFKASLLSVVNGVLGAYFKGVEANADGMINDSCQYCKFKGFCYAPNVAEANQILLSYPVKPYDPTINYDTE